MSKVLDFLKEKTVYTGPKDVEGFELLETDYEGSDKDGYDKDMDTDDNQTEDAPPEEEKTQPSDVTQPNKKKPLNVDDWNKAKKHEDAENESKQAENENLDQAKDVSSELDVNFKKIQKEFISNKNSDIIIRQFKIGKQINAFIAFIDGMADSKDINNFILRQLMLPGIFESMSNEECPITYIEDNVLSVHDTEREKKYELIIRQVLNGLTALFIEGCKECILFETRGFDKRGVEKPTTENVIRGSQEAFNENLRTNITLIRRIIKNNHLITEILPVGKANNSSCAMLYMDGIVNPKIVDEVKKRIYDIDTDFVSGDGMVEQFIEDKPSSLFPQILSTERPDRVAMFLMEGKVAIIVDGTPFVLIVPINFYSMLKTSEESNMKWQFGTAIRLVRLFALFISVLLPGLYIALVLYHQEMVPTDLLVAIVKSRENVPFPAVIETLLMEISFELIREAGLRVPGVIGATLGIIGALILGQAAVGANIVSPILIIVVAVTGLGNFALPNFSLGISIRILRFLFMILGGIAGFLGISVGIFIVGGSLCSIKSFGVPFLTPIAPKTRGASELIFKKSIRESANRPDPLNTLKRSKKN